jgi:hypothetical protein
LILTEKENATSNFRGVAIQRINKQGDFVNESDLSDTYVIPIGEMKLIDSVAYFVAMEPVSLNAVLIAVNPNNQTSVTTLNSSFPLAASWTSDNQLILLSYEPDNLQSQLSLYGVDGQASASVNYSIGPGSDVQQEILNHYLNPEQDQLPFFCGEWSPGNYYFNGFYNYSLSMVFTDLGNTPTGVVQGQGSNGVISAAQPIAGSLFSIVGHQFSDSFVRPNVELSTGATTASIDLMGSPISEFRAKTPSSITAITVNNESYTLVAAETESRQIALYFYELTGALVGIQKIGFINPYTVASVKSDADGNLLILGTTFTGGRFERIYFQKINADQLQDWL